MTTCRICNAPLGQPATGRRRLYCSDRCRIQARRRPKAQPDAEPGPLSSAITEALATLPLKDDPRRRILALELRSVAIELDADPTGRPALIGALERLVTSVFTPGTSSTPVVDEMPLDAWLRALYGPES